MLRKLSVFGRKNKTIINKLFSPLRRKLIYDFLKVDFDFIQGNPSLYKVRPQRRSLLKRTNVLLLTISIVAQIVRLSITFFIPTGGKI